MSQQRDRSRILTPEALAQLQQAIRAWELQHEKKCTQERIRELTSEFKEGGLDQGTISKIRKGREGVDAESIRHVFRAFGLQLQETDLVSSAQAMFQVDPNFVGREGAIADLNMLVSREAKVIVIQARGGVGKTTLARKFLQQEFGQVLEFPIAKETKDIASIESLIEEKLRQLGEEPGREFLVSIDRLKRKLQTERIGILIDNLEPALDSAGRLIEAHRRYVELLRVLADPSVRSTTLITSRERLHEPSVAVQHYPLRSLEVAAWEQFFQLRQLKADTPALAALHHAYGGNAKAMEILSSVIKQDYSENIEAYWQENQNDLLIERDLEDLVTSQFNRLQAQDEDAYKLLCRMGCYRYQDMPTVPIEGSFCLLWDVPENRQKRVVRVLQERSLIDVKDGEYWLHPVIRSEAIGRLRGSEDWKITNCSAAEFWTESVKSVETVEDALRALEPYYHYLEINDCNHAGNIFLIARENSWLGNFLPEVLNDEVRYSSLGASLCRLGLFKQAISAISQIIDDIELSESQCRLYHRLAALYLPFGQIRKAIECSEKAVRIATEFDIQHIKIGSLIHIGYCKIDLLEFEEAFQIFNSINLLSNTVPYKRSISSWARLAFLHSCLGQNEEAIELTEKVISALPGKHIGIRGRAYVLLYLGMIFKNLVEFEKSSEFYQEAILYSEKIHFAQVKAQALIGLAELYRERQSIKMALTHHSEAIEILEKIGAVCSLAEAYYQVGLTYKALNETDRSRKIFQEAIRLFTEMEAPKQVERVMRSMQQGG